MLNDAEKKSIQRAKEYLIKRGICALDGSGESNVEALFLKIHRLNEQNSKLLNACKDSLYFLKEGVSWCPAKLRDGLEATIAKVERR